MHTVFDKTFSLFIIMGGIYTSGAGLLTVSPELITPLFLLGFEKEYTLLIQHWGFTTFLIGLAMIISVYKPMWREPVFLIAAVEKLYMLYLVIYHHSMGFVSVAVIDTLISIYLLSYLYSLQKQTQGDKRII